MNTNLLKPIIITIIYLFIFDIILTSRIIYNFGIEHELNPLIYKSYTDPGYFLIYLFLITSSFILFIIVYYNPIKFNLYLFSIFLIFYYLLNASNVTIATRLYLKKDMLITNILFTITVISIFIISYVITNREMIKEK